MTHWSNAKRDRYREYEHRKTCPHSINKRQQSSGFAIKVSHVSGRGGYGLAEIYYRQEDGELIELPVGYFRVGREHNERSHVYHFRALCIKHFVFLNSMEKAE